MIKQWKRKDISDIEIIIALYNHKKFNVGVPLHIWISELTGCPEKVCWSAVLRCHDNGYIDYGVSLNFPWLTQKALFSLKAFNYEC